MPGANRNNVKFAIELDGRAVTRLNGALKVLGERDAPFLRKALEESAQDLAGEIRQRAPGSIGQKVELRGVKGTGASIRATGSDLHPGARSMEFGRVWYWTGYTRTGNRIQGGQKVKRTGQQARPFMGVIDGGHAIGAVAPKAKARIMAAISQEWERIASED